MSLLVVCVGTGLAIGQSPLTGSAAQKGVKMADQISKSVY
jgi:hypothetical protein